MTDRELLELAAKAAGYSVRTDLTYDRGAVIDDGIIWNPLNNDGDALRLAVKLGMLLDTKDEGSSSVAVNVQVVGHYIYEEYSNDPYAATRRAIVRAAAEIGKEMK